MPQRFARGVALAALAVIIVVLALALVWHVVSADHPGAAVAACLAIMGIAAALLPPVRRPLPVVAASLSAASLAFDRTLPESDRPPELGETLRC